MNKTAFIFPGQGAQKCGMGKDFYENSELAKEIFDTATAELGLDMTKLCFEENEQLDQTEYTQAAMVTACLAMTAEIEKRGLTPDVTAGLSLGEYCAISAAGGMQPNYRKDRSGRKGSRVFKSSRSKKGGSVKCKWSVPLKDAGKCRRRACEGNGEEKF